MARELTSQQRAFVDAYLANGLSNASAAYRVAYPTSQKWAAATVASEADRLVSHPGIAPIIAAARAKAVQRTEAAVDRYVVSKERIVRELARMAFADPRRFFDWSKNGVDVKASADLTDDDAAAVVEVSHTRTAEGGTIRVKLADRRGALMDLARLRGDIPEATRTVRLIKDVRDLTDEELSALAEPGESERDGTRH